jgi:hypothetical protein
MCENIICRGKLRWWVIDTHSARTHERVRSVSNFMAIEMMKGALDYMVDQRKFTVHMQQELT